MQKVSNIELKKLVIEQLMCDGEHPLNSLRQFENISSASFSEEET
jgi:hypothetical protein